MEGEVFELGRAEPRGDGEAVVPCDVAFEGGYVFCVEVKNDGDGDD